MKASVFQISVLGLVLLGSLAHPRIVRAEGNRAGVERQYLICIGEHRELCDPFRTLHLDGYYGCNFSEEQVAEKVCTIYKGGRRRVVSPHKVTQVSWETGNLCGYKFIRVVCLDQF